MAKNKKKAPLEYKKLSSQFQTDFDALKDIHDTFSAKEKILLGVTGDNLSQTTRSQVYDPTLQTSILRQNSSVMAQMPTGRVQALSKKDRGKSLFMDLIIRNYVVPNARTQHDIYTKLWLLSLYRKIYGSFGVLVDYVVSDKYVGPDFSLIPARCIVPQEGKFSVDDSDYIHVVSTVSRAWLESRGGEWKNIDKVLESPMGKKDSEKQSYAEEAFGSGLQGKDTFELVTKYEGDKWTTFSRDAGVVVRETENKHKNDALPVVMVHAYPLLDRFFGLGEVERGITLHYAQNSLINLYLDGIKKTVQPPLKIDLQNVVARTIKNEAGAKWVMRNSKMEAVQEVNMSPQGLNTFQSTYGFLKGAVLSLTNSSDTSVSSSVDVGMGKTPQALKMQQALEAQKTTFDRRMLEIGIEQIYDKMIDLIAHKQEKPIKLNIFNKSDLEAVSDANPDVLDMFESGDAGEVIIKPEYVRDCKYKFFINASSTMQKDEAMENQTIIGLIEILMKVPGFVEQVMQTGEFILGDKKLVFSELIKRMIMTSGLDDTEKMIVENEQDPNITQQEDMTQGVEQPGLRQQFQAQQFADQDINALMQELQGGAGGTS